MQDAVYEEEAQDADHLSPDEVRETIRQLGKGDAAKIRQAAGWFERRCGMPADDLMQEAFVRMIGGSRRVPRGPDFVAVVLQVVRSIASGEIDAILKGNGRSVPFRMEQTLRRWWILALHPSAWSCLRMIMGRYLRRSTTSSKATSIFSFSWRACAMGCWGRNWSSSSRLTRKVSPPFVNVLNVNC